MTTSSNVLSYAAILGLVAFPAACFLFRMGWRESLFFAVLLLPNVWLSRFDQNEFTPLNLEVPTFLVVLVFIATVALLFSDKQTAYLLRSPARTLRVGMIFLLAALVLSNVIAAEDKGDIVRGLHAALFVVLPPVAAWGAIRCCRIDEVGIVRGVTAVLLVSGFAASISIVSAVFPEVSRGFLAAYRRSQETERAFTPLGGPSAVGMYLLVGYCLAVGMFITRRQRALALVVMGLCFVALLTTLARAVLVVFLITNIYLYGGPVHGLGKKVGTLLVVGMFVLLPCALLLGRSYALDRFTEGWTDKSGTSMGLRLQSMETAVRLGINHVPFGVGWGLAYYPAREVGDKEAKEKVLVFEEGQSASKPHSLFALVFAEAGLFGLISVILWMLLLWKNMRVPNPRVDFSGHCLTRAFRAGFLGVVLLSGVQDHLFFTSKISFAVYLVTFMGIGASRYYGVFVPARCVADPG